MKVTWTIRQDHYVEQVSTAQGSATTWNIVLGSGIIGSGTSHVQGRSSDSRIP